MSRRSGHSVSVTHPYTSWTRGLCGPVAIKANSSSIPSEKSSLLLRSSIGGMALGGLVLTANKTQDLVRTLLSLTEVGYSPRAFPQGMSHSFNFDLICAFEAFSYISPLFLYDKVFWVIFLDNYFLCVWNISQESSFEREDIFSTLRHDFIFMPVEIIISEMH